MLNSKKIKLGVIFGGQSKEHEVSLSSARAVLGNLDLEKYDIVPIAITKKGSWLINEKAQKYLDIQKGYVQEDSISAEQSQSLVASDDTDKTLQHLTKDNPNMAKVDLILPLIHGSFGEDGRLQGLLEMFGVPYVFSGVLPSALSIDKSKSKLIAKQAGLNVMEEVVLKKNKNYKIADVMKNMSYPVVVKPVDLGSSVGVSIVNDGKELEQGIKHAFIFGDKVMVEQFKQGRELTVAVLGNNPAKALPVIEIIPQSSSFYNYEAKYAAGGSDHKCPADIPDNIKQKVQQDSIKLFEDLECSDLARIDFIYNEEDNDVYFLEINTVPGMTSTSLVPEAAKEEGLNFPEFLNRLITEALKRYQ